MMNSTFVGIDDREYGRSGIGISHGRDIHHFLSNDWLAENLRVPSKMLGWLNGAVTLRI